MKTVLIQYLIFRWASICGNYSKAAPPYIAYILFKFFGLKLLPFLLSVLPYFLLCYREPALYPLF